MEFTAEINSIFRSDNYPELILGKIYSFEKKGSRIFFDSIPVWLTRNDWTAQAEISIISQTLENNTLKGTFRVDYIYQGSEQLTVTQMFMRMYSGLSDPYIYLLSSQKEYDHAVNQGKLARDSIKTEGFIHASPKNQLTRIANKYYKETINPLILVVDKSKITAEVKWEPATGGLYPHIYGVLNTEAIIEAKTIALNKSGEFLL
ncbi:DUF952 domain-containing protein [Colwellia sp. UCD-KL20]|uniref:DUF952 domain-containing protein n=1 Tax=Colwellia sp. UCD-KL20 TaxID=1917165 RepID=UPI0009FB2E6E|nr:DUF952 domain-containing protein [Colwellia sp. UCD-KL20]